jgi:hypothetical protein
MDLIAAGFFMESALSKMGFFARPPVGGLAGSE